MLTNQSAVTGQTISVTDWLLAAARALPMIGGHGMRHQPYAAPDSMDSVEVSELPIEAWDEAAAAWS